MARDPIPTGYTTLPEAVALVAAKMADRDIGNLRQLCETLGPLNDIVILGRGDGAEALRRALLSDGADIGPHSQPRKEELNDSDKRERAILELRSALQHDALIGFVRDPASGTMFRLTGADWWQAIYWRDIILGGQVKALKGESIARHAERTVLIETAAFDKWLGHRTDRERRAAIKNCLGWLVGKMLESPEGTDRPKPEWFREAEEKFGVSKRAFDQAWATALGSTGARWSKVGRKKSARVIAAPI